MIVKCIAILALVAQINASLCGCGPSPVVSPNLGCCSQPAVLATSLNSGSSCGSVVVGPSVSSAPITRNIVAKGKYPVALNNCGPTQNQQIPVTISHVTAPLQEKPTIRLPARIPAPRTICHTCTCYKTILRPRVNQQIVTVPTVQSYIETLHKPVVENIQYEAVPVNCEGTGSSSIGMISLGSGSSCVSPVQAIQVPSCVQPIQISQTQPIEVPQVQPVQISCAQPAQIASGVSPCVQSISAPCVQRVEISQTSGCSC